LSFIPATRYALRTFDCAMDAPNSIGERYFLIVQTV
jgi:hypothetical protein